MDGMTNINVYCDESCHLENDHQKAMALGCIWIAKSDVPRVTEELKAIKKAYNTNGELKWIKVSKKNLAFYLSLVDWFFNESSLHFRALVVQDKSSLDHNKFNGGSHDAFYYKMYFTMLNGILIKENSHQIFIDKKDTRSRTKIHALKDILCRDRFDFNGHMVKEIRHIHSDQVQLVQLTDFLLGSISYKNRYLTTSTAKLAVIEKIEQKLGKTLLQSSPLSESKLNIFVWTGQK